ncbi:hypothetical protein L2E82_11739 [Cichorium intybus]|uniref:Uncharacterized protein n=1 Tax=Cichorium intybus TaxID=13427 RepID=A0ACB9GES4_CICIN|nr:hypothetical protein L2E82_11739 [Cichorium intybus]
MGTNSKQTTKKKPKNSIPAVAETITKSKKRTRKVSQSKPQPACPIGDIEDFQFREDEVKEIRASLLKWYDVNRRDLPWRRINDSDDADRDRKAYAVWVSEIMLQQTRVQTVVNYFNRWMEKWPTVQHLAQASIEEVNEMWAGLGYYRRARFLLEGAKSIVEEGGQFPRSLNDLRRVRGIGEYTAGAIASIAFNEAVPVVDGNVVRVIARLRTISANPKDKETVKIIWRLAGQLVDDNRPGDFNQALMELGATLCTFLNPNCSSCPISAQCNALLESKQNPKTVVTDYPTKVAKVKQRRDFSAISVVEILECEEGRVDTKINSRDSSSKFLLVKRPEEGLLAGLWEFPSVSLKGEEADLVERREAIDEFLKNSFGLKLDIVAREEVGEYVHIFTHIRLKMYIELLVLRSQDLRTKEKADMSYKYVDMKTLGSMGLSTGVRKAYNMVQKFKQSRSSLLKTVCS